MGESALPRCWSQCTDDLLNGKSYLARAAAVIKHYCFSAHMASVILKQKRAAGSKAS